jgi:hypothetical protein
MTAPTTIIQTRAESSPARDSRGGDAALHGASHPRSDAAPPRNVSATWTDERTEELKKLWSEGLSASAIARQIGGVTRNSVLGKVHRLSGLCAPRKVGSGGGPRRKYDHERVVTLWAEGKSLADIAVLCALPSPHRASGIVQAFRHRGDSRAARRVAKRQSELGTRGIFLREARRRNISARRLADELRRVVARDNLFDAVLGAPGESA